MRMVKVEFTATERIAVDGIHITKFNVGTIAELPEAVAAIAVKEKSDGGLGCARVVGYAVEVKDAGAAPENKAVNVMPSVVLEDVVTKSNEKPTAKKAPAAARGRAGRKE